MKRQLCAVLIALIGTLCGWVHAATVEFSTSGNAVAVCALMYRGLLHDVTFAEGSYEDVFGPWEFTSQLNLGEPLAQTAGNILADILRQAALSRQSRFLAISRKAEDAALIQRSP